VALSPERIAELGAAEEFVLTVAQDGSGKRSSAYDYRVMGRGNQGVAAHDMSKVKELAACFPVIDGDTVMAVTDGGQLIRFPVDTVRIAARATKGVRLIRLAEGEKVVSVVRIAESDDDTGVDEGDEGEAPAPDAPQDEQ
jgi:DNA gyrase subunit A